MRPKAGQRDGRASLEVLLPRYRLQSVARSCVVGVLTLSLAACGPFGGGDPTATPPTATVAPTAIAPASPISTAPAVTATPQPTATVAPPTATILPTATTAPPTSTPVPPTATVAPTATHTPVQPPPTAPPTLAPTATLPPPPTTIPATTAIDPQGLCSITLPIGFAATGGGVFTGFGGRSTITLTALAAEPDDTLDDVALPFISTATAAITDYRQSRAIKGTDSLRIDFTGHLVQPGTGTFYLRQFGTTVCALSFFVVQGTEMSYEQTLTQLLASLRAAGAVGTAPRRLS